jgi:lysophospholipase L1-like esterase
MRAFILAALAAIVISGLAPEARAQISLPFGAQPAQPTPQPEGPPPPGAPPSGAEIAPPPAAPTIQIVWEVKNRFRLFRRNADFQRQVTASRAGSVLGAEHFLERESGGRGWAQNVVDHLCVSSSGALLETCERDGARENYLAPKDHLIVARVTGNVPPGATCNWSFDDGTIPPKQVNGSCSDITEQRVASGKPTIAAVGMTRPDGSVESASAEIVVRDLLIAGLGDSVASGEGNPDRPIKLADEGFCFQRFLGAARGQYFRPSRAGFTGDKACDSNPAGSPAAAADWNKRGARWMSAACHRSLYGYQIRTAIELAVESPQSAVTFLPLACSGAAIDGGLFGSQGASECPPTGRCSTTVPSQITQLGNMLAAVRKADPNRKLDLVLLTIGANDIKFSGLVADVIISEGVERVLFNQGGLIASVSEAQDILSRELPRRFAKLRAALKPMVGGDLSRVVYVSYGNPAMAGDAPCPGGRDGLDVHPAFTADGARLQRVSDFVMRKFLPALKALARCEGGVICSNPDTDRMTFIDAHQAAFAQHGFCAHAASDPDFDRDCFSVEGKSFDPDPVTAATSPLVCSRSADEFLPYAPRARWIRTANDSYFTAMTFPRGLPATMQPSNIHDATWGALSAVYGGAFHPSAEGAAVMADAALPGAREVLNLKAPPEVVAQPLPPPLLLPPGLPSLPSLPSLPVPALPGSTPPQAAPAQ